MADDSKGNQQEEKPAPAKEEKPKIPTTQAQGVLPGATLAVPSYSKALNISPLDGAPLRSTSPSRLSTELTLKVQSQFARLACLRSMLDALPDDANESSVEENAALSAQAEELHKAFLKEHQYFEAKWPASQLDHDYFSQNAHAQELDIITTYRRLLGRHKKTLLRDRPMPQLLQYTSDESFRARLPDLGLPSFSGEYEQWPHFRELFGARIMEDPRLSNVEKLMYLRGCLSEAPAKLINSLPLTGDSLDVSWELLTSRFENKRLIIQAHLDQLMGVTPLTSRSAAGLNQLILTVSEANKALQSLGVTADMWDCILVHHVSKQLDRQTREQWETSLGSAIEYPRFAQLESFVTSRARALERIESSQPASSPKPQQPRTSTAHQASAQQGPTQTTSQPKPLLNAAYQCDCCKGNHFIVSCSAFRAKTPANRKQVAVDKRLCFNCLGRHNARSCRSEVRCKECNAHHHTMLHEFAPSNSSQSTQQSSEPAQLSASSQN